MRHSSGFSVSSRRLFHGWNSTVDICTAQITAASSVTQSSSAVRFQRGKCSWTVSSQGGAPVRHPLLVHLVAGQSLGEAVQHARPLEERVDDARADGEVVLDQVELGRAALREVDPVGVADPHDPVVDLDLDRRRLRGHALQSRGWQRLRFGHGLRPASRRPCRGGPGAPPGPARLADDDPRRRPARRRGFGALPRRHLPRRRERVGEVHARRGGRDGVRPGRRRRLDRKPARHPGDGVSSWARRCGCSAASGRARWGFFLRAETMHGFYSLPGGQPGPQRASASTR